MFVNRIDWQLVKRLRDDRIIFKLMKQLLLQLPVNVHYFNEQLKQPLLSYRWQLNEIIKEELNG